MLWLSFVIVLSGLVIIILLWKIFKEVKKNPYHQASYRGKSDCSCQVCRFWHPSPLLPPSAQDSGDRLHSPEGFLLGHIVH
jgi:hypothetical protein